MLEFSAKERKNEISTVALLNPELGQPMDIYTWEMADGVDYLTNTAFVSGLCKVTFLYTEARALKESELSLLLPAEWLWNAHQLPFVIHACQDFIAGSIDRRSDDQVDMADSVHIKSVETAEWDNLNFAFKAPKPKTQIAESEDSCD